MKVIDISWREFRGEILDHIEKKKGSRLCRGQANSEWKLRTSFHRYNLKKISFQDYFEKLIPYLADAIGTLEGRDIDVSNPLVNGAFLAYAQHHGLPTPLLDWTYSPYKAAYYAFSSIEDTRPTSNKVAIYIFNHEKWAQYQQLYNYDTEYEHVSLLQARAKGNHRQIYQQGTYFFTNVEDIEKHISLSEERDNEVFLIKYLFSVKEKPIVMEELETMGINAYSLFGGTDGMFRFFKESVFRADSVGETPAENLKRLMEYWQKQAEEKGNLPEQEQFPQIKTLVQRQEPQLSLFETSNKLDSE